jgi:hypothetical protein
MIGSYSYRFGHATHATAHPITAEGGDEPGK